MFKRGSTMTATDHEDQLGEIYPTMLNELNCTFGVSFSRFHCYGRRGHGLWPSWYRPVQILPISSHTSVQPSMPLVDCLQCR